MLCHAHDRVVHSRRVQILAARFAELIPRGHRLLDIGCGDGIVGHLIREQRPDVVVEGVDVLVRPKTFIPVRLYDGRRLPFDDRSFDSVLLCDVLHHVDSAGDLLCEAARVVRGCVLIKDHLRQGFFASTTLRFMDYVGNAPHGVVLPYNYLTPLEWQEQFRRTGLKPRVEITHLGLYPWWANWLFGRSLHFIGLYDKTLRGGPV
jgi:SAM-dependent methyltransferase